MLSRKGVCAVLTGALLVSLVPMAATSASASQPSQVAISRTPMMQQGLVLSQGPYSNWTQAETRSLQYLLRARGARIAVDGIVGPQTEAAVVAFQRTHHLVVDGIVGPQTWGALYITLALGSRGDAVRAVQEQANFRNLKNGHTLVVDGIFGPLTRAWVIQFQQEVVYSDKSFPVDGVVGPLTWPPLVGGMYSY
jgi:peptidoglycan hydrolase-like protein with peptidoglycan-binding domain